jgi:hypothetical protein
MTGTSLTSEQTANESFVSRWNMDVQQVAPTNPPSSSHLLDCSDRKVRKDFEIVMVFAYESIKQTEQLKKLDGSTIQRQDIAARLAKFGEVRETVEKEATEKVAKQTADAEEAWRKRIKRKTQISDRKYRSTLQEWKECFEFLSFDKFKADTTMLGVSESVVTVLPMEVEDQATVKFVAKLLQGPRRLLRSGAHSVRPDIV